MMNVLNKSLIKANGEEIDERFPAPEDAIEILAEYENDGEKYRIIKHDNEFYVGHFDKLLAFQKSGEQWVGGYSYTWIPKKVNGATPLQLLSALKVSGLPDSRAREIWAEYNG